jgi:hypothetical protein
MESIRPRTSRHTSVPSFGACEVSCRVRAEREKPYACSTLAIHPKTGKVHPGSPVPGATRGSASWLWLCFSGDILLRLETVNVTTRFVGAQASNRVLALWLIEKPSSRGQGGNLLAFFGTGGIRARL